MKKTIAISDTLYRFRWVLGAAALFLCVLFSLHGSSIGMWNTYMPDPYTEDTGLLLGEDRAIRSDEWNVFTPMTLSQYANDFGVTSDFPRAAETDVYLIYGQPVRDWSILFRPFQIGYLFLRPARGLSFYWCGKLIALLIVSWDFGLLITRKKKLLSFAYASAVAFAPVVQWWFSINAFPDMLIYGQGIILCLSRYLTTPQYGRRALYAFGMSMLSGAYLLVLYPAWQIPFFYVFAAVGIWVIRSNRKKCVFQWKKDLPLLGGALLLLAVCMGWILYRSWDTVQTVLHSAYPGNRRETGGWGISSLVQYIGSLFFPFNDRRLPINVCGLALFYDLFPCGLIGSVILLFRRKKKDILSVTLICVMLFLGIFTVFGFPLFLADLSLLSQAPPFRTLTAISYINLLLLFRSLARIRKARIRLPRLLAVLLSLGAAMTLAYLSYVLLYRSYYSLSMLLICMAVLFVLFVSAFLNDKVFSVCVIVLSLVIGGYVNPVRTGLDALENHTLGNEIRRIASQDDGAWLVVSDDWPPTSFPLMYGARTINCTNTYINRALWEKLDPAQQYVDVYNRYAHLTVHLSKKKDTSARLLYADSVLLTLNIRDFSKLNAEYVLTDADLIALSDENVQFEEVYADPGIAFHIYRVLLRTAAAPQ